MTIFYENAMMHLIKIEVAFIMSTLLDATGAKEKREKGMTPKEEMTCKSILGHAVNSCMTVIRFTDGALSEEYPWILFAGVHAPAIFNESNYGGKVRWQYSKELE